MRCLPLCLVLAACASGGASSAPEPAPAYAPVETVTVRATASETTRRLVALYTADNVPITSINGGTVTTAPVGAVALSAGSGALGASGSVAYFYRATIAGDTPSAVTLALWGRFTVRSGSDPSSPPDDGPVTATCATNPKCAPYLARMKRHAAALRESP